MKALSAVKFLPLLLGLAGCGPKPPNDSPATPPAAAPDAHNSRTSLDWAGTYQGVLPCADCEGIDTRLTLASDGTYQIRTRYLGKSDTVFWASGSFAWNEAGAIVTLAGQEEGASRYQVVENALIQLDRDGGRIEGALAERYRLAKRVAPTEGPVAALMARRWLLVEVLGKPVAPAGQGKEAELRFDWVEERVSGTGGCNTFSGPFELGDGNRIRFPGPMAATKMACPDMTTDEAMQDALAQVDNWTMQADSLSLNRARMAPLLRLVAR
jgi:heat shock protein HslJ